VKTLGFLLAFSVVCLVHFLVWYYTLAAFVCNEQGALEASTIVTVALAVIAGLIFSSREFCK
jgi:hypothetical protein